MNIIIIGPIYPYKGGIAHYTGLMAMNLCKDHQVKVISYSFQYPAFLYKKEQKAYGNDSFDFKDKKYLINTLNPVSWIKTAKYINASNADVVIFQWWHPYFAPCYWSIANIIRGKKIIFVCHNVLPHEKVPLQRFITKNIFKKGNAFIIHSNKDADDLKSLLNDPTYRVAVLPTFNSFKISDISKKAAREMLNISNDDKVLLFFGFVREYKGLKHLIRAMPQIKAALDNIKLLVVGDFDSDKNKYLKLIEDMNCEICIRVLDGYVPDNEVEAFFSASDLVVLPYESATQSGIVPIAYGFNKPVIVTNVGGLPEVVIDNKTGYIVPASDPEAISEAVVRFFQADKENEFKENIKQEAYKYSWDRMNEVVDDIINRI